jgi:hypothetical protein
MDFDKSPRAWYKMLREAMETMGFESATSDTSLYIQAAGNEKTYVLVYVDDLLIIGRASAVQTVKKQIAAKFKVKDAGEGTYFLGMSIRRERSAGKLWVGQHNYARGVLQRAAMHDCKPRRAARRATCRQPLFEELEQFSNKRSSGRCRKRSQHIGAFDC